MPNKLYDFPFWAQLTDECIARLVKSKHWFYLLLSIYQIDEEPTKQVRNNIELFLKELLHNDLVTGYKIYEVTEWPYASSFEINFKHLDSLIAKAIIGSDFLEEPTQVCELSPAGFVKVANRLYEMMKSSDDVKLLYDSMLVAEFHAHSTMFSAISSQYKRTASVEVTDDIIKLIREGELGELKQFFRVSARNMPEGKIYLPIPLPLFDESSHGKSNSQEVLEVLNMWYRTVNSAAQDMSLKQAWMANTKLAQKFLKGKASVAFKMRNRSLKGARDAVIKSLFKSGIANAPSSGQSEGYKTVLHEHMIRYNGVGLQQVLYPWGSRLAEVALNEFLNGKATPLSSAALSVDRTFIPALESSLDRMDILNLAEERGLATASDWVALLEKVFSKIPLGKDPIVEQAIVRSIEFEAYQKSNWEVVKALESVRHHGYDGLGSRFSVLTCDRLKSLKEYNDTHGTDILARHRSIWVFAENVEEAEVIQKLNREDAKFQGKLKSMANGGIFSETEIKNTLAGADVTIGARIFSSDEVITISSLHGVPLGLEGKLDDFWFVMFDLLEYRKPGNLWELSGRLKAWLD